MTVGAEIRALREARSWSRAELARKVNLSEVYVEKIEAGERVPTLSTLRRIARVLGAELHVELVERRNR